ncbi:hypothetical protein M8J76_015144 [Diaphorina citri]|nr:hypothetical protein M8J75_012953 [Diaphorina citri]KAI5722876.1 hypothetical protein M8J76_015144 [Diaphorina citri]
MNRRESVTADNDDCCRIGRGNWKQYTGREDPEKPEQPGWSYNYNVPEVIQHNTTSGMKRQHYKLQVG